MMYRNITLFRNLVYWSVLITSHVTKVGKNNETRKEASQRVNQGSHQTVSVLN